MALIVAGGPHEQARILDSLSALFSLAVLLAAPAGADILYSCPGGGSGDGIWRGFYVENYKGTALGTVALSYHTNQDVGAYTVSLTAHEGAFDGPVIGTAEVVFDENGLEALFDFHDAPVTEGVTVAFVQSLVSGPEGAAVYYYVGSCGLGDEACEPVPVDRRDGRNRSAALDFPSRQCGDHDHRHGEHPGRDKDVGAAADDLPLAGGLDLQRRVAHPLRSSSRGPSVAC